MGGRLWLMTRSSPYDGDTSLAGLRRTGELAHNHWLPGATYEVTRSW